MINQQIISRFQTWTSTKNLIANHLFRKPISRLTKFLRSTTQREKEFSLRFRLQNWIEKSMISRHSSKRIRWVWRILFRMIVVTKMNSLMILILFWTLLIIQMSSSSLRSSLKLIWEHRSNLSTGSQVWTKDQMGLVIEAGIKVKSNQELINSQ